MPVVIAVRIPQDVAAAGRHLSGYEYVYTIFICIHYMYICICIHYMYMYLYTLHLYVYTTSIHPAEGALGPEARSPAPVATKYTIT